MLSSVIWLVASLAVVLLLILIIFEIQDYRETKKINKTVESEYKKTKIDIEH